MPRTEKLKIKTSLVNVAIVGTLAVITVAVGITLPNGEMLSYESVGLFGLGAFCGFVHARLMDVIEFDSVMTQYEKERAMYLDGNYTPPTAATDVSQGDNHE